MTQRFFRTADAALYESLRLQLDESWGLSAHGCTCITPATLAPRDQQGRIVLAVNAEFCDYEAAAAALPQLLATGAVEEIAQQQYMAALPPPYPQATVNINIVPAGPNSVRLL